MKLHKHFFLPDVPEELTSQCEQVGTQYFAKTRVESFGQIALSIELNALQ